MTYDEMRTNAEKLADEDLKKRILRGLTVLHNKYGDQWVDHIDPKRLAMGLTTQCILGQINYGNSYYEEKEFLGITYPRDYGFDAEFYETYAELTDAWLVVLGDR